MPKIALRGAPFSIANRREVTADGEHIGELWANAPKHNWGGGGVSYTFTANERGRRMGFETFVAADSVKDSVARLTQQAGGDA